MARAVAIAFLVLAAAAYGFGFVVDHVTDYDAASEAEQVWIERAWDASIYAPLLGAAVAAWTWPRWFVPLALAVVLFLVPLGVHEIELANGKEPLGDACDPCIDTTFISVFAFPALVIGYVAYGIRRFTRRRRARASGGGSPAARSGSGG